MTITKKQVISLLLISLLVVLLPLGILLTKKKQDIRPKAVQGKANLQMNASTTKTGVGENIDVKLSMYLTDAKLRVSGADIVVLYDKNKLDPINVVPAVSDSGSPFTDAPIVSSGGYFDNVYNYLRISEVARKSDDQLPPTDGSPIVSLGYVTFKAKGQGSAVIKYPEDNKYLEIVGTSVESNNVTPTGTTTSVTPVTSEATLSIIPAQQDIGVGTLADYTLVLKVVNGSTSRKLEYFKTTLAFPKEILEMSDSNPYVSTIDSGFLKIFRVTDMVGANQDGQIVIELGADKVGNGPSTDKDLTIAKFKLKGKTFATDQKITIGETEIGEWANNDAKALTVTKQDALFNVKGV